MAHYERLSGLDEAFLAFETANSPMHVALTTIFAGGSLVDAAGKLDATRVRRYIASRLPLIPRYRQRLASVPVLEDMVWVDDDCFDLEYHVRHVSLPRPGGERQLQRRCAEILERPLDRRRPLWEAWLIEGLEGGRFAMLTKVHHCMVDGVAGVDILAALLGLEATGEVGKSARWTPRPAPRGRELLRDEILRRARKSVGLVGELPRVVGDLQTGGGGIGKRASALWNLLRSGMEDIVPLPFNEPIGPHRRVEWMSFDLAEVKEVRRRLGGTLNDVVLATVAGAMRLYLQERGVRRVGGDFRVVVPVSVRAEAERGADGLGNRVSAWIVSLPIHVRSGVKRLQTVIATTAQLKNSEQALGAQMLTEAAEWTTGNVLNLAARFISQSRLYNLIVTNVPGPQAPLYLLDARMEASYPHLPLFENQGLGVALFSYDGKLFWGFGGDWSLVPDIANFRRHVAESFGELRNAAMQGSPSRAPRRRQRMRGGAEPAAEDSEDVDREGALTAS
jgi:WS/DGAT/MGAT family acyltransferase